MEDSTAIPDAPGSEEEHDSEDELEPPAAPAPRQLVRSIPAQIGRGLVLGLVLYVLWLLIQLFL